MTQKKMTYLTDACLITCAVPAGKADDILKAARDLGLIGGVVFQGRGTGIRERLGILGIAVEADKEIVMMLAPNDSRNIVIDSLFKAGEMDAPGAGFIFATPVDRAATYVPDTVIENINVSDHV